MDMKKRCKIKPRETAGRNKEAGKDAECSLFVSKVEKQPISQIWIIQGVGMLSDGESGTEEKRSRIPRS